MPEYEPSNYAIEVNCVNKNFKVYHDKGYTLKERLLFFYRNNYEKREVLKNISFKVKKGEAVGLIGENGAGKSTMLKLLSRIMYPDTGKIIINGRVACLIELGAGFHPDMTGRENIYVNAAIFGLSKKEIDSRINDIIFFSELEQFIDNPVRTYSSGMYMRLAFSIAINVDADILLIDEILAVGDAAFQAKCFARLNEIKKLGTTIVLVSHSLEQIEAICDRSIWFKNATITHDGSTTEVNAYYMDYMLRKQLVKHDNNISIKSCIDDSLILKNEFNDAQLRFSTGKSLKFILKFKMQESNITVYIKFVIYRSDGIYCCGISIPSTIQEKIKKQGENKKIEFKIEQLNLLAGNYFVDIFYYDQNQLLLKYSRKATAFIVQNDNVRTDDGVVALSYKWL